MNVMMNVNCQWDFLGATLCFRILCHPCQRRQVWMIGWKWRVKSSWSIRDLVVRELVEGQRRWNLQTTSPHHPEFIQSFRTFLDPTIDPREDSLCGPLQRRRCFCARGFGTRNPKIWQQSCAVWHTKCTKCLIRDRQVQRFQSNLADLSWF